MLVLNLRNGGGTMEHLGFRTKVTQWQPRGLSFLGIFVLFFVSFTAQSAPQATMADFLTLNRFVTEMEDIYHHFDDRVFFQFLEEKDALERLEEEREGCELSPLRSKKYIGQLFYRMAVESFEYVPLKYRPSEAQMKRAMGELKQLVSKNQRFHHCSFEGRFYGSYEVHYFQSPGYKFLLEIRFKN